MYDFSNFSIEEDLHRIPCLSLVNCAAPPTAGVDMIIEPLPVKVRGYKFNIQGNIVKLLPLFYYCSKLF